MVEKIKVACAARTDPDFMIFGRCDGLRPLGMRETLERSRAYVAAGADGLWVFGGDDAEPREMEEIAHACPDIPLIYCWSEHGAQRRVPLYQIAPLGYRRVIPPDLVP